MVEVVLKDFDKNLNLALQRIGLNFTEALKSRLTKEHGKDTGHLQASINYEIDGDDIIINMNHYGQYLEFGTPPHMPPVEALEGWVSRKFNINDPDEKNQAAWALAMHIKRWGTKPHPFIRTSFNEDLNRIVKDALIKSFK